MKKKIRIIFLLGILSCLFTISSHAAVTLNGNYTASELYNYLRSNSIQTGDIVVNGNITDDGSMISITDYLLSSSISCDDLIFSRSSVNLNGRMGPISLSPKRIVLPDTSSFSLKCTDVYFKKVNVIAGNTNQSVSFDVETNNVSSYTISALSFTGSKKMNYNLKTNHAECTINTSSCSNVALKCTGSVNDYSYTDPVIKLGQCKNVTVECTIGQSTASGDFFNQTRANVTAYGDYKILTPIDSIVTDNWSSNVEVTKKATITNLSSNLTVKTIDWSVSKATTGPYTIYENATILDTGTRYDNLYTRTLSNWENLHWVTQACSYKYYLSGTYDISWLWLTMNGTFKNCRFEITHTPKYGTAPAAYDGKRFCVTTTSPLNLIRTSFVGTFALENFNNSVSIKDCTSTTGFTCGSAEVVVDGGSYTGSPAFTGSNITVKRGTITDLNDQKSTFLVDADSESTVVKDGSSTITTVKLSNPPVIIDWGEFPGIDLDIDMSAPVISVTRSPASTVTPTKQVALSISATDPNGTDCKISVNGGAFTSPAATATASYTATENQVVSIIAVDANGNTREYQVNITNIDAEAPEVVSLKTTSDAWTKGTVKAVVEATDDQKLHATAYNFTFTPYGGSATSSGWQASKYYTVSKPGILTVKVRDSITGTGHETTSDQLAINNIDLTAPSVTLALASTAKVTPDEGVEIVASVNNVELSNTSMASPMHENFIKWSTDPAYGTETRKRVHANGTYTVTVRDSCGNTGSASITVSNISTTKPTITKLSGTHQQSNGTQKAAVRSPVTLTATATFQSGMQPAKPYSWDLGKTWTSANTHTIYGNGEYTVWVRDTVGAYSEASIIVSNIDDTPPSVSVYLFKGAPADWNRPAAPTVDDYVWKVGVICEDTGSGVQTIKTLWDNGTYTNPSGVAAFEVEEAGSYGVIVTDVAGNQTYAEKVVTWESIGESGGGGGGSGAYVGVEVPPEGTGGRAFSATGTSSLGDLVFAQTGAYNKSDGNFYNYAPGQAGITANLAVTAKKNKYLEGYATFGGVKYPVNFDGYSDDFILVDTRDPMLVTVFIPIADITADVRNGRLQVVFNEWEDSGKTELLRSGSATLYTSAQITAPKINHSYNSALDEMVVSASSSVVGIKELSYSKNGGASYTPYTSAFTVGSCTTLKLKAVDKTGNTTIAELDVASLPLTGEGGGTIPTDTLPDGSPLASYYISNRTSETYIINGTRSNTNNVPAPEVFELLAG